MIILAAELPTQEVPSWAWALIATGALTLLGSMATVLWWFIRREFDRHREDLKRIEGRLQEELSRVDRNLERMRDEIARQVTPLREEGAQTRALTTGFYRELQERVPKVQMRASDEKLIATLEARARSEQEDE